MFQVEVIQKDMNFCLQDTDITVCQKTFGTQILLITCHSPDVWWMSEEGGGNALDKCVHWGKGKSYDCYRSLYRVRQEGRKEGRICPFTRFKILYRKWAVTSSTELFKPLVMWLLSRLHLRRRGAVMVQFSLASTRPMFEASSFTMTSFARLAPRLAHPWAVPAQDTGWGGLGRALD